MILIGSLSLTIIGDNRLNKTATYEKICGKDLLKKLSRRKDIVRPSDLPLCIR